MPGGGGGGGGGHPPTHTFGGSLKRSKAPGSYVFIVLVATEAVGLREPSRFLLSGRQ